MAMTDRLAMDAHFHGYDGALLLAEYSFAEITLNNRKTHLSFAPAVMQRAQTIGGFFNWI